MGEGNARITNIKKRKYSFLFQAARKTTKKNNNKAGKVNVPSCKNEILPQLLNARESKGIK